MRRYIRGPALLVARRINPIICRRLFQTSTDTYGKVIEIYGRDRDLESGRVLHAHLIINGLARRTHLTSKLLALYVVCGKVSTARKMFDKIAQTNIRRWIVLIGAYARCGFHQQALDAFREMQKMGLRPNIFVVPSVLKAYGHLSDSRAGEKLHAVILKHSFDYDLFVNSSLIDMYSKTGQVQKARRVFDTRVEKDLVSLNALVSGYAQHGLPEEALNLVEKTQVEGRVTPNIVTWNTLVAGFSQKGDEVMVSQLFKSMIDKGIEPDVVSWTSIISGLVKNFRNKEAFDTFKEMLDHGLCPTSATISTLLSACSVVANVRRGKEIHGYALVIGVGEDMYVRSALVDMYAKCGFIYDARALFFTMTRRNTVTWNSMIFGYANNGYCSEAIELFKQMEEDEKKLDHLTFTAVLNACSHAGMVALGQSLFHLMQEEYRIIPRLEHYACIVDLLGRAGKLTEAYDMIKAMPIKPDLFVWGALLGACRNHGNIDMAEIAATHLRELEPEGAGNKLLLSNLYADAGSWGNVARLKKTMNRNKFRKFPGCSWIETI
ncbi:Tetratricopeptide-like helical domain containing protein [Parasponia andersonii]|uniref:Tetratricopeptide-like helical domain containing protein n=1 Tax=Parasponia andersonii TaxID=3476 RepID=A0A2P5DQN7_PARAD|nr:Tetratricopeptide-like helical domain containing protein [Parasponia andersonii]